VASGEAAEIVSRGFGDSRGGVAAGDGESGGGFGAAFEALAASSVVEAVGSCGWNAAVGFGVAAECGSESATQIATPAPTAANSANRIKRDMLLMCLP
jgi:hypothetical protein